mgnify:CR=1 FL=1
MDEKTEVESNINTKEVEAIEGENINTKEVEAIEGENNNKKEVESADRENTNIKEEVPAVRENANMKEVELRDGDNIYKCKIELKDEYFEAFIYDNNNELIHQGDIHVNRIRSQIYAFTDVKIAEIFDEINKLGNNKFNWLKDQNKLQIEFSIFNRQKFITICLDDNLTNNDYLRAIKDLREQIKEKDNRIKLYEDIMAKNKIKDVNASAFSAFKKCKHELKYHTEPIFCTVSLKDGRFATGSKDKTIIVFNNKTFKPDLTIKEHNGVVVNMIELSTGELASCSEDKTIKIYDVGLKTYRVIQTLKDHTGWVSKIIELNNKQLVSCSKDKTLIFYNKDKDGIKYKKDFSITTNGWNGPVIQTKDNEICYYESNEDTICFYDFIKKKTNKTMSNITVTAFNSLLMLTKELLLICRYNKITVMNVYTYNIVRSIDVPDSDWISSVIRFNKDQIVTADENKRIILWKIEGDNLRMITKNDKAHDGCIFSLTKLPNGTILTGGLDCSAKIW